MGKKKIFEYYRYDKVNPFDFSGIRGYLPTPKDDLFDFENDRDIGEEDDD